jgi:DhnA family fructose-bisphosphate aldolase class Ia
MVNQTGWKGGLLIGHKQMAMVSRVQKHLNYHESVNDIMPFIDGIGRELNPDIIKIKYTRDQIFYNEYMNFVKRIMLQISTRFKICCWHAECR